MATNDDDDDDRVDRKSEIEFVGIGFLCGFVLRSWEERRKTRAKNNKPNDTIITR